MVRIEGAVVVLTGASRGIGEAMAEELARRGARVALVARSPEGLAEVAGRLRASGAICGTFPCDLTQLDELPGLVAEIEEKLGPIDVLINNAGIETFQHFADADLGGLERSVVLNVTSPLVLTRLVLPGMLERGRGQVVNMASVAGLLGTPYGAVYSATKAAVIAATHSLRQEYAGQPVGFSCLCPSFTHGAGMHEVHKEEAGKAPWILGGTTVEAVVRAACRAIEQDSGEVVVNDTPMRPLVGLGRLLPGLADWITRTAAAGYMRSIADARRQGESR